MNFSFVTCEIEWQWEPFRYWFWCTCPERSLCLGCATECQSVVGCSRRKGLQESWERIAYSQTPSLPSYQQWLTYSVQCSGEIGDGILLPGLRKVECLAFKTASAGWRSSTQNHLRRRKKVYSCTRNVLATRREQIARKQMQGLLLDPEHNLSSRLPVRLAYTNRLNNFYCRTDIRKNSFFPYVTLLLNGASMLFVF